MYQRQFCFGPEQGHFGLYFTGCSSWKLKMFVSFQAMLTHWTKKIIVEEGHTVAQLVHMLYVTFPNLTCYLRRVQNNVQFSTLTNQCSKITCIIVRETLNPLWTRIQRFPLMHLI